MSGPAKTSGRRFSWQGGGAILVVGFLSWAVWSAGDRALYEPPRPAVLSPHTPRASQDCCAECHSDITDDFPSAPHFRTLTRATDPKVAARFAGRSFHRAETGVEFHYRQEEGRLMLSTPAYARDLAIDWIIGSGTHAQTPLITWTDADGNTAAIEHAVSWYPSGELDLTLSMEAVDEQHGLFALGLPRTPAETINCFGCHGTYVPTAGGRILFEDIEAGIGCARCHWDTERHVRDMEQGLPLAIEKFSELSPEESINRCGECHRRPDELGGPISADDKTLPRFAPVGLAQSLCFKKQHAMVLESGQPARMDCTTCHDPHRDSSGDWRFYAQKCLSCHDAAHDKAPDCPKAAREDNCLPCHMPKVEANPQLKFTDHWIRVRPGEWR